MNTYIKKIWADNCEAKIQVSDDFLLVESRKNRKHSIKILGNEVDLMTGTATIKCKTPEEAEDYCEFAKRMLLLAETATRKQLAAYLTEIDAQIAETKHGVPTRADTFYRKGKRDALEKVQTELTRLLKLA